MKKQTLLLCLVGLLVAGFYSAASAASEYNGDADSLRSVLEKWVEAKKLISSEKQNWLAQKEILVDRSQLLNEQVADLREKITASGTDLDQTEEKAGDLRTAYEKLASAMSALESEIAALENRTMTLLKRLPEPVKEQVAPLSQEIPGDPENTTMPLSTRYQNLIGVLNYINKFNNAVTLTTEVREFDGANAVEVKVMYVGLGQAYFANDAATVGGVGRPTAAGWTWERKDNIAPAVSSAIAMYNSEETADYVALPVEIEN